MCRPDPGTTVTVLLMKGENMTESTATTKPVKKFAGIEIASGLTKTNYFFLFFNTFIIGMFMSVPSVLQPAFLKDIINIPMIKVLKNRKK